MRRIRVSKNMVTSLSEYEEKLQKAQNFGKITINPLSRLNQLKGVLEDANSVIQRKDNGKLRNITEDERDIYKKYVSFVIDKFQNKQLLLLTPSGMTLLIAEFAQKGWENLPLTELKLPNRKDAKPWGTIIYETMQYQQVRQFVMPQYIRNLGIKTCCYCNAEYTITDRHGVGYYQLDHWKPKSLYPYLCISFFNLQPCCAYCNNHKSNEDQLEFLNLYEDRDSEPLDVFEFHIERDNIDAYINNHQSDNIQVKWQEKSPQYKKMREDMDAVLHINDIYEEHKDEVEELIWRSLFYRGSFREAIKDAKVGIELTEEEVNRFVLGTYSSDEDVHKRPLTKMKQDLAKDMGLK